VINKVVFIFASLGDEGSIKAILSESGLPNEDITSHLEHFIMAKVGNDLIGVAGLEPIGELGLVRSLTVAPSHRGKGLGKLLYEKIVSYAHLQGIKELYLLTTTEEGFFKNLGFKNVKRENIPAQIKETTEFKYLCPSNAICMVRRIDKEVHHYLVRPCYPDWIAFFS
jgi:amino-acid N-acetyltransferase